MDRQGAYSIPNCPFSLAYTVGLPMTQLSIATGNSLFIVYIEFVISAGISVTSLLATGLPNRSMCSSGYTA